MSADTQARADRAFADVFGGPENQFWCEQGGTDVVVSAQTDGLLVAVRTTINGETRLLGGTVAWFRVARLRDRLSTLIAEQDSAPAGQGVSDA